MLSLKQRKMMDWTKYKNFLTRSLPNIFEVTGNENSTRGLACVTGARINPPPFSPSFWSPTPFEAYIRVILFDPWNWY